MVVKEIIVGIVTSIFSLISKYLKELLIFSIGFYVGSAFFPSLDYSYIANTPIKEIVSDIKEDGTADEIYTELKAVGLAHENCIIAPLGLDAVNVLNIIKAL